MKLSSGLMLSTTGFALLTAAAWFATAPSAEAALVKQAKRSEANSIAISDLRPGMKGHAVTVFQGEQTDKFEIEVVDTIRNYLPKQDAVLFRSTDPRLQHSGIVGGMSGSPIYIDGKLVGALAYGWRFNKDPLGGITPIDNMLQVGDLPYRPDVLPHPRQLRSRDGVAAWADTMLGLETSALPERRRPHEMEAATAIEPLSLPLSLAGFGGHATGMLAEAFGMTPVRGGSSGSDSRDANVTPKVWKPGDAVSVVLVQGDSSVAGNGTVTWVGPKGDRLLAFGHSMFNDGPTNVPMADARVHAIIPSVERSVKLSSPLTIRGLMYQDRQAGIALRTDLRAPMIPVSTSFQGPDPDLPMRTYNSEVAMGVDITPNLVAAILAEAVDEAGRDSTEVVLKVKHHIALATTKGPREVTIEEEAFFADGLVGRMMARSRGVAVLNAMLNNRFEVARLRSIRHEIAMEYAAPVEEIEEVRLQESEIRAGDIVRLEVILRGYKGERRREIIPLRIPDEASDQEIEIEIAGGDLVRPYRQLPGSLDDLITTLSMSYPSRSVVATIYREGEGLATEHGLLQTVPNSVLETLSPRSSTQSGVRFKQMARRVLPTEQLVEGRHTLRLDVLPPTTL